MKMEMKVILQIILIGRCHFVVVVVFCNWGNMNLMHKTFSLFPFQNNADSFIKFNAYGESPLAVTLMGCNFTFQPATNTNITRILPMSQLPSYHLTVGIETLE